MHNIACTTNTILHVNFLFTLKSNKGTFNELLSEYNIKFPNMSCKKLKLNLFPVENV